MKETRDEESIVRRNTKQKTLVLMTVREHRDHPTADSIYLDVRKKNPRISKGTVYRNLKELSRTGDINHLSVPGADRYDLRLDPHSHVFCTLCGSVEDASVEYDSLLDERVARLTSYSVTGHQTVFEGICPFCRQKGLK